MEKQQVVPGSVAPLVEASGGKSPRRWLGALFVAAAIVIATAIGAFTLVRVAELKLRAHSLSVTGSATRRIRSDRVIWTARVQARAPSLVEAYRILQGGVPRVREYLVGHEIPPTEITIGSVTTQELYARNADGMEIPEQIIAYNLSQPVTVTSSDIDRVTTVSQGITSLIEAGVQVESYAPEYIYTQLGPLKVELIAEATRDARTRAQQVASNSGAQLRGLELARVGVVQINAANESSVSWDGVYDRSAIDKDAMTVVTTVFSIE